jgi:CheY-like chemotaxis protein
MFNVLVVDDDYEDRDILKLEIERALKNTEPDIRFFEASNIKKAREMLNARLFDLLTLDIQFDRLNEGLDALPEFFESYPTLNIIVVSGKLDKSEVAEKLFRFTKDNVLKSKRWSRHFDVLDKKDDKAEAIQHAHSFAIKQNEGGDKIRELFLQAESYLEKDMVDKCLEIYEELQRLVPGEMESKENLEMLQGVSSVFHALQYFRKGDKVAAALLLGHYVEKRLKVFSKSVLGRPHTTLSECSRELERKGGLKKYKRVVFQKLIQIRNQAIHQPLTLTETDFQAAASHLESLEENH